MIGQAKAEHSETEGPDTRGQPKLAAIASTDASPNDSDGEAPIPSYLVKGRDLRVDLFRGVIMMSVISAHAFMLSAISFVFWERVGIVSSGEGFVLLSGIVIGMVYTRVLAKQGFGQVCTKIFARSAQLYRTYLAVSVAIVVARLVPGIDTADLTSFTNRMTGEVYQLFPPVGVPWWQTLSRIARMQAGPHQYQVIGLYVVLMIFAPFILWALHKGHTRMVLGVSWAIYAANVAETTRLSWGSFEYAFPTYVWQILFVHGLALGAHWNAVNEYLFSPRGRRVRWSAVGVALAFAIFSWNHPQPDLASWVQLHWVPPPVFGSLYGSYFSKTGLGIGRLMNVACLFVALLWAVTRWWDPLARTVGRFLIPMGQATLYVFIVHVFLILALNQLPWAKSPNFYVATAIHCSMILSVFLMVRYKVLFSIIPR